MAFTEKYVTVAGAGAHDGSTEGNAWTFAEMIAAAVAAETRVNMKAGSYSIGATTLTANATVSGPCVIRGYNTTPGDLDNQNRGSDGLLDTTNYPDITITGIVVPVNFWILQNLDITGALSSTLIGGATHDRWSMVNCRVVNTQNNASAQAVRGDDFVVFVNCDFACTGAAHFAVVQCDFNAKILGCTFSGVQTNQYLLYIATTSTIADCVFFGPGGTSFGLYFGQLYTSEPSCVANCTFYNLGTAIQTGNNAPASGLFVYNCHVTDCSKFIDNLNAATNQITVIEVNNRLRDVTTPRTGVISGVLASEVTTDAGDYTTDYISSTNLRLKSTAAGKGVGMMPYRDIGAYQCAYPTLPAAADVQSGAANYGYADALLDPSYPTTATTEAAHLAADKAYLNTHKDEMIAANTDIKARFACDDGIAAGGGGYTYGDEDPSQVLTTADGAGTLDLSLYTLSSGIVWPLEKNVLEAEISWGPTGAEYTGLYVEPVQAGYSTLAPTYGAFATHGLLDASKIRDATYGTLADGSVLVAAGGLYVDPSNGDVRKDVEVGTQPRLGTWDAVTKTDVVAAEFVVVGNERWVGGAAGEYPTTATSQAAQLATDIAAVDADKANILDTATILTVTGTYDTTVDYNSGYAAGLIDQFVTDAAAVDAVKAGILTTVTVLGVTGTLDLSLYTLTSTVVSTIDAAKADILNSRTLFTVTGTFNEASRNTDPGELNVADGVSYKILNIDHVGTGDGGTVVVVITSEGESIVSEAL